jgi:hypothetical protein
MSSVLKQQMIVDNVNGAGDTMLSGSTWPSTSCNGVRTIIVESLRRSV